MALLAVAVMLLGWIGRPDVVEARGDCCVVDVRVVCDCDSKLALVLELVVVVVVVDVVLNVGVIERAAIEPGCV